jgi:hypothetical protein
LPSSEREPRGHVDLERTAASEPDIERVVKVSLGIVLFVALGASMHDD